MSDSNLAPYCELPSSPPPQPVGRGAQRVPLEKLVQVFKATYKAPFDSETPLPPHYWELQRLNGPDLFIRGTRSDKDGLSGIIDGKKVRDAAVDDRWYLVLRPDLSAEDLGIVAQTQEVWIDIEKNTWAVLPAFPQQEQRKLIRVPLWTSRWKVHSGGFAGGPPGSFLINGTLTTADIRGKFGTRAKPWLIQIDFGWWMTFVQFQHYDHALKMFFPVPPGLAIKALGSKLDVRSLTRQPGRVGGGTCVDDAGTVCVLHERTEDQSADVELAFEHDSGVVTFVELKPTVIPGNQGFRMHQKPAAKVPVLPTDRYLLPATWHSLGWEARVGTDPRKAWSDLKPTAISTNPFVSLATNVSNPVIFNLDDTVLVDSVNGVAPIPAGARVTLFDHRLAFRGPSFDPAVPARSAGNLAGSYLQAEETIVADGDAFEASTFVINHEGDFFVRREARVDMGATGKFGVSAGIGLRKAVARAPEEPFGPSPMAGDPSMLLLLPDAYPGPYTAAVEGPFLAAHPDAKICHLLVYVSVKLEADGGNATATPPFAPVKKKDLVNVGFLLRDAAERWDQLHPAHAPFSRARKDYVAIPSAGVKAGTRVVKLRHFFGTRTDGKHALTIHVTNEDLRSNVDAAHTRMVLSLSSRNVEANGVGLIADADSDGVSEQFFAIAHELGHVMGLPDEYMERITIETSLPTVPTSPPVVPRFLQRDEAYPFWADKSGLMRGVKVPRLRYYAHRLAFVNTILAALPEGPYVLHHPTFRGGLTYQLGSAQHAWEVFQTAQIPSKRATLVLYRSGDDEGTMEAVFPRSPLSSIAAQGFLDSIVVVRTLLWFSFRASAAGDFASNDQRWAVIQNFYTNVVWNANYAPPKRFVLQGPAGAILRNIGVVLEPRFEFEPFPAVTDTGAIPSEQMADVSLEIVFQKDDGKPAVSPTGIGKNFFTRHRVNLHAEGAGILRFVLGLLIDADNPDNRPLDTLDLEPVARTVELMLGQPANSFVVRVLP